MDLDSLEKGVIFRLRELKKSGFGKIEVVVLNHNIHNLHFNPSYTANDLVEFAEKAEGAGTLTR